MAGEHTYDTAADCVLTTPHHHFSTIGLHQSHGDRDRDTVTNFEHTQLK